MVFDDITTQNQRAICERATPRPWHFEAIDRQSLLLCGEKSEEQVILVSERCDSCLKKDRLCVWPNKADAEYIEAACNNYPQALERIAELQAYVDELVERLEG